MSLPLVSIIIPVYNTEEYLDECLDSCINQTYTNLEIICINDGSTDNSLQILEKYAKTDKRIKVIDKKNEGVGTARNIGIDSALGEWVTFLDSDDFFELDGIESLVNSSFSNDADMIIGNYYYYDSLNEYKRINRVQFKEKFYPSELHNKVFTYEDISGTIFQIFSAMIYGILYKKNFLNKNNIRFSKLKFVEDQVFKCDAILSKAKVFITDRYIVSYRNDRVGNTIEKRRSGFDSTSVKFHFEIKKIFEKHNLLIELEKTYTILQFSLFMYCYKLLETKEDYYKLSKYYRETGFNDIGITKDSAEKYLSEKNYRIFESIVNDLPPVFLLGKTQRLVINMEDLRERNIRLINKKFILERRIEKVKKQLAKMKNSTSWKIGRLITRPMRKIKSIKKSR
jgi:glycosyltransferase involved in cell wall biosynthesis